MAKGVNPAIPCSADRLLKVASMTLFLQLALFLPAGIALGQTNFGQVNGTVYDQTGKVVPNATVTLHDLDRNTQRTTTGSATGTYAILEVPTARYSLTITAPGFETSVVPEFLLHINEALTLDAHLTLGAVTQTVEVKAAAVAVNRTDATIATVIQSQELTGIPLNGRNFSQLQLLAPGVSPVAAGQQTVFSITGGESYSVNGMRYMSNNFTLDGIENNMRFTNSYADAPPPEALAEFKIDSHQSDSAAALAAGANINLVTKAGTNTFHGSMWDYLRNNDLAANGFANNFYGLHLPGYKQNQFGFYLGGPLVIPHLLDGRKTGTYLSGWYEGIRFLQTALTSAIVPDAAERNGNFSDLLGPQLTDASGHPAVDCLGRPVYQGEIYDISTTVANTACTVGGGYARTPFPNNTIPSVNPIAADYLSYLYPMPNRGGIPGAAGDNLILGQESQLSSNQWGVRGDQSIGDKSSLFARFAWYNYDKTSPGALPLNPFQQVNHGYNLAGHYTRSISPTFLFDFSGGYNRATIPYRDVPEAKSWYDLVGATFATPVATGWLPPGDTLLGGRFSSAGFVYYDLANPDDTYQFKEDFKKVKGSHSFTWGFNLDHYRHHVQDQGASSIIFSNLTSGQPGYGNTGEAMASFEEGYPQSSSRYFSPPQSVHGNIYIGYGGDTWKVTPKFTVDLGLQYVYVSPGIGNDLALPDLGKELTCQTCTDFSFAYLWSSTNPITGAAPNTSRGIIAPDRNNFAPRFGLAYSINDRTVIRTGFGVFYDYGTNLVQNNSRGFAYPFSDSQAIGGQNVTTIGPNNPPLMLTSSNAFAPLTPNLANPSGGIDLHRRDPYAMEWNFGIERMLPDQWKLSLNYVGSGGRKLPVNIMYSQATIGTGPFLQRRWFPNNPTNFFYISDSGTSNYDALQLELLRQFARGFTLRNSFTWGKNLDLETDPNSATDIDYTWDRRLSYGHAGTDIRVDNTTALVYDLPVGRGKRFAASSSRLVDAAIGGWEVSGIITYRTGTPFTLLSGQDNENTGNYIAYATEPANKVGPLFSNFPTSCPQGLGPGHCYFSPNAFAVPAFGTIGNAGKNSFYGPGYRDWDMGLMKNFKIKDQLALELRGEFFNAFNQTSWSNPSSSMTSPTLGQIYSTYSPRIVQVALKLHW